MRGGVPGLDPRTSSRLPRWERGRPDTAGDITGRPAPCLSGACRSAGKARMPSPEAGLSRAGVQLPSAGARQRNPNSWPSTSQAASPPSVSSPPAVGTPAGQVRRAPGAAFALLQCQDCQTAPWHDRGQKLDGALASLVPLAGKAPLSSEWIVDSGRGAPSPVELPATDPRATLQREDSRRPRPGSRGST
jgi:hypothetical protein